MTRVQLSLPFARFVVASLVFFLFCAHESRAADTAGSGPGQISGGVEAPPTMDYYGGLPMCNTGQTGIRYPDCQVGTCVPFGGPGGGNVCCSPTDPNCGCPPCAGGQVRGPRGADFSCGQCCDANDPNGCCPPCPGSGGPSYPGPDGRCQCCDSGVRCGDLCCHLSQYTNPACLPGPNTCCEACGSSGECCLTGEVCQQDGSSSVCCLPDRWCPNAPQGARCCQAGNRCVNQSVCCPVERACGSKCCPEGQSCLDGASGRCGCRATETQCGASCCPQGQFCFNGTECRGSCPQGSTACGGVCCAQGQTCGAGNVCVEPACPPERICNGTCCPAGATCDGFKCQCPAGESLCPNSGAAKSCCKDGYCQPDGTCTEDQTEVFVRE